MNDDAVHSRDAQHDRPPRSFQRCLVEREVAPLSPGQTCDQSRQENEEGANHLRSTCMVSVKRPRESIYSLSRAATQHVDRLRKLTHCSMKPWTSERSCWIASSPRTYWRAGHGLRLAHSSGIRSVFTKMLNELAASGNQGSLAASLLLFRAQTFTAQNRSAEALADARQALPVARAAQGDHPYSHWTGQVWLALAKYQHQGGRTCRGTSVGSECARESRGDAERRSPFDQGRARARSGARESGYRKLADSRANHAGPLKPICTDS